jgi:hypothetical protein
MPFLEWHLPGVKFSVHYLELGLNCGLRTYCELVTEDSLITHNWGLIANV